MLVATFEVQVSRPFQFFALFQDGIMGRAGVEPYVHGIGKFVVIFAIFRAQEFALIKREPCFDAFSFDFLGNFFQQLGRVWMQFTGLFVNKEGHRRAPVALARNHPVRTAFNHGFQTRTTP